MEVVHEVDRGGGRRRCAQPGRRRSPALVAALVVLVSLVVGSGMTVDEAAAQDTAAVAVNTRDGSSLFRLVFQIRRTTDSVLDSQNAAVAYSSCTECLTVAASFQVVLSFTDPDVATPGNFAIALNESCSTCVGIAEATQIVLGTDGPVRFTDEGSRQLAELRQRLQSIRTAELTPEQLAAELDAIGDELEKIVATELAPAGAPAGAAGTTTVPPGTTGAGDPTTTTSTTAQDGTTTTTARSTTTTAGGSTTSAPASTTTTTSTSATAVSTTTAP